MTATVCLAQAIAHAAPHVLRGLSPLERYVLANRLSWWLRPEQRIPFTDWRSCYLQAGRGWGKTHAVCVYINECVRTGRVSNDPERGIALMAPNEDRVEEVQIANLIATAPAWFKPERYAGGLVWPNGARAYAFTPEAPGRPRGGNFELAWFTEVVDFQESTRWLAFTNTTSATRRGIAQYLLDTTAMGTNEIIAYMHAEHARAPSRNIQVLGETFDNPILTRDYIESECAKYTGRRLLEEIFGRSFAGNAGAKFSQEKIDANRVPVAPSFDRALVAVDPAQSDSAESDETGIVAGGQHGAHYYLAEDASGRYTPGAWGAKTIEVALRWNAVGVFVERNKLGDGATFPIEVAARAAGLTVRMLDKGDPFPPFAPPGVLYVKCVQTGETKLGRADGPAALTTQGRVHHVGTFASLEKELRTFDGSGKSPNRYDAAVYVISELAELGREMPHDGKAAIAGAAAAAKALAGMTAPSVDPSAVAALFAGAAGSWRVGL